MGFCRLLQELAVKSIRFTRRAKSKEQGAGSRELGVRSQRSSEVRGRVRVACDLSARYAWPIVEMDPFSYICVLTSIVAGLAVTRLVSGFGQLLQTRARTPPYWVHALWMVNILLTIIITWWIQYRWRNVPHWTLFLFLWLLVAPLILYLVAALLFPTNQDDVVVTSWRQHYYANNEKIFALFGLTFAIDLVDTLLKGVTYFLSLGPLYYGSMLMQIALCAIAATTKSPRYHAFFAVFYLTYNLAMVGSNLLRLM